MDDTGPFQLGNLKSGEVEEVRRKVLRDKLGLDAESFKEAPKPKRPMRKGPKTRNEKPQVRRTVRRTGR